jgi:hypothetical protein
MCLSRTVRTPSVKRHRTSSTVPRCLPALSDPAGRPRIPPDISERDGEPSAGQGRLSEDTAVAAGSLVSLVLKPVCGTVRRWVGPR